MPLILLLSSLFLAPIAMAGQSAPVGEFSAVYDVSRNGNNMGRATLELRDNHDGTWTFTSHTEGTEGLARMAGLRVRETSTFRWQDGRPQAISYAYSMRGALKKRQHEMSFEQQPPRVRVHDKSGEHDYPGAAGMIDRSLVNIALMADLARSEAPIEELTYAVAGRTGVQQQSYRVAGTPTVEVPAGTFATTQLQRQRGSRTSTTWLSAAAGGLPVQISHSENDGRDVTVMQLASWHD